LREYEEEWRALCERACVEQDPTKLLELTRKIVDLLDKKQKRPMNQVKLRVKLRLHL
jgi:hypothetical protein